MGGNSIVLGLTWRNAVELAEKRRRAQAQRCFQAIAQGSVVCSYLHRMLSCDWSTYSHQCWSLSPSRNRHRLQNITNKHKESYQTSSVRAIWIYWHHPQRSETRCSVSLWEPALPKQTSPNDFESKPMQSASCSITNALNRSSVRAISLLCSWCRNITIYSRIINA